MSTIRTRLKRLAQRGQGTIEYLGIGVLISVLIAALVTFPIGDAIGKGLRGVVCQITHAASPSATFDGTDSKDFSPAPALATTISTPNSIEILAGKCPLAPENADGKADTKSTKGTNSDSKKSDKNSGKSSSKNSGNSKDSGKPSGSKSDSKKDSKDSSKSGKKESPVKGDTVDVSPQGFEGPFVKGKDGYIYDGDGNRVPYSNSKRRPSYADGQVEEVWERSRDEQLEDIKNGDLKKDKNGFVPTELKEDEIYVVDIDGNWRSVRWKPGESREGKWDMGHLPGEEYRKTHRDYLSGKISREEFLEIYRDPNNYKVEDDKRNRSGKDEDKSDQ